MSISTYQESVFFHYILANQTFLNTTKAEFFSNQTLRDLFDIAKDHTINYKAPPSKEQMEELIRIKGLGEKYNEDITTALYNTKEQLKEYDPDWLEKNVGPWIRVRNLDNVMRKSIAFMKTNKVTAENASGIVEKVRHMMSTETAIDFSFDLGSDFFDAATHKQERLARTKTGYSFIDLCLNGGWWKGSLIVFLSGPKTGKSMWMCNLAAHSVYNGFNTAFITLELQREIVNMRIGANMLNVPIDEYEKLTKDQDLLKKKLSKLKKDSFGKLGQLHVKEFPSSTMSTNDLRTYLVKAQEMLGFKFENVFVDYINIMKNWRNPNTENLYMKIKQISEDLRAIAQEEQWAIITPTQTNRSGWDTNDLVISNVSESAALLHTVDGLFGIIVDAQMKAQGEYYLKYLADRVSGMENTRKKFKFNRKYVRIEEDVDSQIEDMEFIANSIGGFRKKGAQGNIAAKISSTIDNNTKDDITGKNLF